MRRTIIICLAFLLSSSVLAGNKQTYHYATKGADTLYLDVHQADTINPKGCVIYAFGGGFMSGQRDHQFFLPFFEFLNKRGYTVASIDYRLGLKVLNKNSKPADMVSALINAVNMAVEDMYDATIFLIDNAKELNIDPQKIIVSGSSAGAITSLQAEYEICNKTKLASRLPQGFNYAGVIAMSGAVISIPNPPQWNGIPCPIAFFHGDADNFVPFDNTGLLGYKMYGSGYLVKQLKRINAPYYFYYAENIDHSLCSQAMIENHNEIDYFLTEYVEKGRRLQTTFLIEDMSKPEKSEKYQFLDFVKTLMAYVK